MDDEKDLIPPIKVKENPTLNDLYILLKIVEYNQKKLMEKIISKNADNDRIIKK